MSKLTLSGDTTKTLGQFLPAPYVEKIILYGDPINSDTNNRFVVKADILMPADSETLLYDSGPVASNTAYKEQLADLNYYIMYFYVNSDKVSSVSNDDEDGIYNQRLPIKYYDQIINEELNPFEAFYLYEESLLRADPQGSYFIGIDQFDPFSSGVGEVSFDEAGNEYIGFSHEVGIVVPYYFSWEETAELRFIVFTSTENYENIVETGAIGDQRMLNIITGDISYETVFQNSTLGDPERSVFVDTEEKIYQEVPLKTINSVPHKIVNVTHEDVIKSFQNLLDQYSTQYNTEVGFENLKKMMDNISVILRTMSDSPNILVALQQLVPTFPDKTPSKPIGKFYKSFRSRIFSLNNSIKTGEILRRKVVYDSKIVDLRATSDVQAISVDYVEGLLQDEMNTYNSQLYIGDSEERYEEFIYTSHLLKEYKDNEQLTSYIDQDEFITINYGNFFFDYEKALKKTSTISRVFDLDKLESFGIAVPFRSFKTFLAVAERKSFSDNADREQGFAQIMCTFEDAGYPASSNVYTYQFGAFEDRGYLYTSPYDILENSPDSHYLATAPSYAIDANPGLNSDTLTGEQPYAPSTFQQLNYIQNDDLRTGFVSSLVVRAFSDPSNVENGYGIGQSSISDYRLMMFQLLDYVSNRIEGEYGAYETHIYILDNTEKLLQELIDQYKNSLEALSEYLSLAQEVCAFNNSTQRFNDFFMDEVNNKYGNNPDNYPWLTAPTVHHMHQDVISDDFRGNKDLITRTAAASSLQISPSTGTLENLQNFVETMQNFYDSFYSEHDDAYDKRTNHYFEDVIFQTGARNFRESQGVAVETEEEQTEAQTGGLGEDEQDIEQGMELEVGLTLDEDAGLGGTGRTGGSATVDDDVDTGRSVEGGAAQAGIQQVGY